MKLSFSKVYSSNFIGWECANCKKQVASNSCGEPSSNYWSVSKNEVYCGAECSLQKKVWRVRNDNNI